MSSLASPAGRGRADRQPEAIVQFIPQTDLAPDTPAILVGENSADGHCIFNGPRTRMPRALIAPTLVESALLLLASPGQPLHHARCATARRFEAGSLLALWALTHPDDALLHAEQLARAGCAAEFGVSAGREASALVCAIAAYEDPYDSPARAALDDPDPDRRAAALYAVALPALGPMLDRIDDFDLLWFGEYSEVVRADALLNSGAVQIEPLPALDLAILDTPLRLHRLVRLTATAGFTRLLTVRSENTYTLEQRYEGWVQGLDPPPAARLRLELLAARLNLFELRAGTWRADPVDTPRPTLWLDDGRGAPAPSSIARETVVAEVTDFLATHADDRELRWSPFDEPVGK